MKKILFLVTLSLFITITSCNWAIQDTPELRAKFPPTVDALSKPEVPCADILGNINSKGEKIYHSPGQANYNNVHPEAYFCSAVEAEAAGFRPALR